MPRFDKGHEFRMDGKEEEEWEAEGKIIAKTDKAILFLPEDMDKGDEFWIPKSQLIDFDEDEEIGEIETVTMTIWIAKKKGLAE